MNIMKTLLILIILTLTSLSLKSQIYFKNSYDEPVWVTLGFYSDTKEYKGWVTKGWYKVAPGEKKQILSYNPLSQNIYYYAQTKDAKKKFEGKASLLVHPTNSFTIKNADKEYVKNENSAYKWYKFRELNKGGIDIVKLKYTIDFKY